MVTAVRIEHEAASPIDELRHRLRLLRMADLDVMTDEQRQAQEAEIAAVEAALATAESEAQA